MEWDSLKRFFQHVASVVNSKLCKWLQGAEEDGGQSISCSSTVRRCCKTRSEEAARHGSNAGRDRPPALGKHLTTEADSLKMWPDQLKSRKLTSLTFVVLFAALAAELGLFLLLAFTAASLRACSKRSLARSFNSSWRDSTLCVMDRRQ